MSERDIGVSGGDMKSSTRSGIREGSNSLAICDAFAFRLLEGMEKLRGTVNGGAGSGVATFDASLGFLFVEDCSFLITKGAECPIPEEVAVLDAILPGGLGSS